uniref:Transmembrane protein n=1 Tax=Peronospora matthiolae TaxID=2874970 RepID=A0AAV1T5T1_9STRA
MELRHRAKGATKKSARGLDVALGPTIYSGERYSKMSERLRRQQKNPSDVADASAQRILRSQVIMFVVALVFVLSLVFSMMYRAHVRRSNREPFDV